MPNVVLRALGRIFERIMGLQDFAEAGSIAGVRIVGMLAHCKMTKYPFYRVQVGIRTDFQDFVIVDEHGGFHNDCAILITLFAMTFGQSAARNRSSTPVPIGPCESGVWPRSLIGAGPFRAVLLKPLSAGSDQRRLCCRTRPLGTAESTAPVGHCGPATAASAIFSFNMIKPPMARATNGGGRYHHSFVMVEKHLKSLPLIEAYRPRKRLRHRRE